VSLCRVSSLLIIVMLSDAVLSKTMLRDFYAECCYAMSFMLSVVKLRVFMLNVVYGACCSWRVSFC
jgi:hypothetical protein